MADNYWVEEVGPVDKTDDEDDGYDPDADDAEEDEEEAPPECAECGSTCDSEGVCTNDACPECPDYTVRCGHCEEECNADGECENVKCGRYFAKVDFKVNGLYTWGADRAVLVESSSEYHLIDIKDGQPFIHGDEEEVQIELNRYWQYAGQTLQQALRQKV